MSFAPILELLRRRAPDFCAVLRGADDDDIAALARLCPRPLPAQYLEFLRAMGGVSAGFVVLPEADHRAATVWRDIAAASASYPEDRYFKVAVDLCFHHDVQHDWFLELGAGDPEDPPVVIFEDTGDVGDFTDVRAQPVAHAWTALLQARLFHLFVVEARAASHEAWLRGAGEPEVRLQRIADVCARLGATPTLPSRPGLHTLESTALSVLIELPPDSGTIRLRIGADTSRECQRIVELIRDDLGE